jgi:glutathione synthase
MQIGFIIEDWNEIEPSKSSTLTIMHECLKRDYEVSVFYPQNLTVRNNVAYGFVKTFQTTEKISENIVTFYKKTKFQEQMLPLHSFDAIMIRRDPPINSIVFNFLDSIKHETLILNDVDGIRKANNKLYTTTFHDPNNMFLPETHVSKNKEYLKRIISESDKNKMILKPLDGSGGQGVIVLEKSATSNINSLLDFYIDRSNNYVILQEFIEDAQKGDVRVLMLNGKQIGAYNRVPADGDIRANIQAGGTAHKYNLTESQKLICRKIGPKLVEDGLFFVGVDFIGDKILEINVLNPGGITNINKLNKVKLQRNVVDFIEEKIHERKEHQEALSHRLKRKSETKNTK